MCMQLSCPEKTTVAVHYMYFRQVRSQQYFIMFDCGGGAKLLYPKYLTMVQNDVGRLLSYINTEGPLAITQLQFCMIGSQ